MATIRPSAVAGQFSPADPARLRAERLASMKSGDTAGPPGRVVGYGPCVLRPVQAFRPLE